MDLQFDDIAHYSHDDLIENEMERLFLYISKRDLEPDTNFAELVKDAISSYSNLEEFEIEPLLPIKNEEKSVSMYLKVSSNLAKELNAKRHRLPIGGGKSARYSLPDLQEPVPETTPHKRPSWGGAVNMAKRIKINIDKLNMNGDKRD